MLWFLASSTLLMALASMMPRAMKQWRRRAMEATPLLIMLLPLMRQGLEGLGFQYPLLGHAMVSAQPHEHEWQIAWGLGTFLGMLAFMQKLKGALRLRRNAHRLPLNLTRQTAAELNLTPTTVSQRFRLCQTTDTPLVVPGLRPVVLLPGNWHHWPARLQRSALRHEWHHVQQGDAWWGCVMQLFCAVFWFHPLAWHLAASWTDECEHLADSAAVGHEDPADYALDLLGLADRVRMPAISWQGVPAFLGPRGSRLQRRVQVLLESHGTCTRIQSTWLAVSGLTLLLLAAAGCAWSGMRSSGVESAAFRHEARLRLAADAFPAD